MFEFTSSDDLRSPMLEVHPDGDEVVVNLDAGQAAVVRRATRHRLSMRARGRLLSINIRSGMQSRHRDERVDAT